MKIQIKIAIALVSLIAIYAGMTVLLSPKNTQINESDKNIISQ